MEKPENAPKLGPVGQRVAKNVKQLRDRVPLRVIADRLADLHHPLHLSGVSKVEAGQRRVDVTDLVALAAVLGVSPSRLLLDDAADDTEMVLVGNKTVTRLAAWRWARGQVGLPETRDGVPHFDFDFSSENRPDLVELSKDRVVGLSQVLGKVTKAAQAVVDNGEASVEQVMAWMEKWASERRLEATLEAVGPQVKALAAKQARAKKATKKRPTGRTTKKGGSR